MSKRSAWLLAGCLAVVVGYITMVVFIRGESIEVPSVIGSTIGGAQTILESKRLFLRERDHRFDDTIPQGRVMAQDPQAGEVVKRGRAIWVVISKGTETVQVPDVREQSLQQAKVKLQLNGLSLGQIARVSSPEHVDVVVAQTPEPPTSVRRGSSVSLLLSAGPPLLSYLMPDFVGSSMGEVRRTLQRVKIRRHKIQYRFDEEVSKGRVIGQDPLPGAQVTPADTIELILSGGPLDQQKYVRLQKVEFEVPRDGPRMRHVRIVIRDDNGEQVLLNDIFERGKFIEKNATIKGQAIIEIYLDNSPEIFQEYRF